MSDEARCPFCLDDLIGQGPVVRCAKCRTPHHAVCFEENGGCTSLGCTSLLSAEAGRSVMFRPKIDLRAWRDVPFDVPPTIARVRNARERIGEARPENAIHLAVKREKLVEGQALDLTMTVDLIEPTALKRVEVALVQEGRRIAAPIMGAGRVSGLRGLLGGLLGREVLRVEPGTFSFEVEVAPLFGGPFKAAPGTFVTVEARLERSGLPEVTSRPVRVESVRPAIDVRERAAPPPPSIADRPAEPRAPWPAPALEALDPEARRAMLDRACRDDHARLDWNAELFSEAREPTPPPSSIDDDEELIVPVRPGQDRPRKPRAEPRRESPRSPAPHEEAKPIKITVKPRQSARAGEWLLIGLRSGTGEQTGRVVRARPASRLLSPSARVISMVGPSRLRASDALSLAVDGSSSTRLVTLELAVRWRPDRGVETCDTAWLVGDRGLVPPVAASLDLVLPLDREILEAARHDGSRTLTVELALDGMTERSEVVRSVTKKVVVDL